MPRNVELKARLRDPQGVRARALALSDGPPAVLTQTDTFFACPQGRLKLRDFGDGTGELIHYRRPDRTGPKTSDYLICRTGDPAPLLAVLTRALGVECVVRKRRELLLRGDTRIHLDEVEGLGSFLELEVVLADGRPEQQGRDQASLLLAALGVPEADLVAQAYADLLRAGPGGTGRG